MRPSLALLALLLATAAQAQAPSPAQMGITQTSPQVLQTLDNTKTWVPLGGVNATNHTFYVPGTGVALSSFGAVSSPTGLPADASAALTAAVNWVNGRPIPIIIDGRYGLQPWSSSLPFDLEGSSNNTRVLQAGSPPAPACQSGFVNLGGPTATLITATGKTARVAGQCIEMATAPGVQTAGVAILFSATAGVIMASPAAENNTIYYPFNGVETEAVAGTQNSAAFIRDNSIIEPSGAGIGIGLTSTCGACGGNGVVITGNLINCNGTYGDGGALGSTKSVGIFISSGAPLVDQNDPYRCAVGTKVVATLPGQAVSGTFAGWLGDTCTQHELMIGVEPGATGATVLKSNFSGWYIGQSNYGNTDQPILIYNKGDTNAVKALSFTGGMIHDANGANGNPINDFWLIQDDVNQLAIVGNYFYNDGGATNPALHIATIGNGGLASIDVIGNIFSGNPWSTGISITGTGDVYNIVGNNFTNATVPISWTTLNPALSRAVIKSNQGSNGLFEYNGPVLALIGEGNNAYVMTYGDNTAGLITITAGATPGNSGNVKLNMNCNAPHSWACGVALGNANWQTAATAKVTGVAGSSTLFWYNNGVTLTAGQTYQLFYNACASQ